ncbi:MAG TPA: flagellar basal body-associated FliL family protein [Candidatus Angelobacter sp.]|nr:flagellar basal body-associated FliL family protein [Candidatus Angelobacter sp.]
MSLLQVPATNKKPRNQRRRVRSLLVVFLLAAGYWLTGCQSGKAEASDGKAVLATLHLEDFVVNLSDGEGRAYLRIGIDLAVENENPKSKSESKPVTVPVIRDSVITLLSTLQSDDLLTPEGKTKLKQDLIKSLNDRLPELKVREVYFNEFMVQR